MKMTSLIKGIKRIKALKIAKHIVEDRISAIKLKTGRYVFHIGSTHRGFSLQESVSYINTVYDDYLRYASLGKADLAGKNILEIGPGDNMGVALRFIAAGTAKVVCIDRIYPSRDKRQQHRIYLALRDCLGQEEKERFDSAVTLKEDKVRFCDDKIKYIYGVDIKDAGKAVKGENFDFIISRAALEHVYDVDAAIGAMDEYLRRGGYHIHKVDLRDHEMFTRDGGNPFSFLTIPAFTWGLMTKHCGKPNRKRADYFEKKFKELGYDYNAWITHLMTRADEIIPHKKQITKAIDYNDEDIKVIDMIRSGLTKEFKRIPDENLLIGGIFIVARKL